MSSCNSFPISRVIYTYAIMRSLDVVACYRYLHTECASYLTVSYYYYYVGVHTGNVACVGILCVCFNKIIRYILYG